jgi:hypothetical protein
MKKTVSVVKSREIIAIERCAGLTVLVYSSGAICRFKQSKARYEDLIAAWKSDDEFITTGGVLTKSQEKNLQDLV